MKTFEVLLSVTENGRDIRVRSDVDKQRWFERIQYPNCKENLVLQKEELNGSGNIRLFMVVYRGSERQAKQYAAALKLLNDGLNIPRSILTQVEE